ncbi:MAG: PilZ domain-containing protein [Deltaproteobacteria bacterium]|nr:PilZ domain-containing protein [Deltaproteobacteria bacterium]
MNTKDTQTKHAGADTEDKREAFRINDSLPFKCRLLSAEKTDIEEGIGSLAQIKENLLQEGSKEFYYLLSAIDRKLDHIVNMLNSSGVPNIPSHINEINLSATGLKFESSEEYKKGDVVKITIGLPPFPHTIVSLMSEVVRVVKKEKRGRCIFDTAVRFIDLGDEQMEDLVHHLFNVQRNKARAKAGD